MTDAPERIWLDREMQPWRVWTIEMNDLPEYIRADLYTALRARLAEVGAERDAVAAVRDMMGNLWADAKDRAKAAEAALATARADALREAAKICEGSSARGEDIFFTILALIDKESK